MLAGVIVLELLAVVLFAAILIRKETHEISQHVQWRLAYQASSLTLQAREALQANQPGWIGLAVRIIGESPAVYIAKITDTQGTTLFASMGGPRDHPLDALERSNLARVHDCKPVIFERGWGKWEVVEAIYTGNQLRGYAWIKNEREYDRQQIKMLWHGAVIFGLVWIFSSAVLVLLLSRSISAPLATLHAGTKALMRSPENSAGFPLPVKVENEIGDLIEAFNRMVASIKEQRAGLNDTLSLLDSMLAHAPIGLAFFDSEGRFVRVNQLFADLSGIPLGSHLGRRIEDLMPEPVAGELSTLVERVFAGASEARELEIGGEGKNPNEPGDSRHAESWNWMVSAYPVRTPPGTVRWAGMIVVDTSLRKRNEEALRKSEKLAATGRLAASIAHEINNPLEAITNLLYLLNNFCQVDEAAKGYLTMAENEARRIAEITQQTLRFYRQQSKPAMVTLDELVGSVLHLFAGRISTHGLQVETRFDGRLELLCYAGELRQVFANLVANAIDASRGGGRLLVRARAGRNWHKPEETGIRFVVADTGVGMRPDVMHRAFEAFFTTKEKTGTGLGLWVSHEIILKHGGVVHLRSRESKGEESSGTVFELFIPGTVVYPEATKG